MSTPQDTWKARLANPGQNVLEIVDIALDGLNPQASFGLVGVGNGRQGKAAVSSSELGRLFAFLGLRSALFRKVDNFSFFQVILQ